MKRILSLALVLVMILSVMPMASAMHALHSDENPDGQHHWERGGAGFTWGDPYVVVQATCSAPGYYGHRCSYEGCPGVKKGEAIPIDANAHDFPETWTYEEGFDCTVGGKKYRVCANNAEHVDEVTVDPGTHTPGEGGVCSVCGKTVAPSVAVSLSATKTTLTVNETATVSVVYTTLPQGVSAVAPTSWTSSDETVLTVSNGTVTAKKAGTATVSAAITAPEGVTLTGLTDGKVSLSFTVTNSGVISGIQNVSTTAGSYTLTPTLTVNGKTPTTVEWDFNGSSSATITGSREIKTITVSVKSYTVDGVTYTNTNNTTVPAKTVKISFYDLEDASATVKSGVASFMFDDTSVFSKATIDSVTMSNPGNITMQNLLTYTGSAELGSYKVVFYPKSSISGVASITYTSIGGDTYGTGASYSFYNTQHLKFTVLSEGEYVFDYYLVTNEDLTIQAGTVTIKTGEGDANIKYKTNYTTAITVDEDDFEDYWKASKLTGDLDYVTFEVDASTPYYGSLYTTASTSTRKAVTDSQKFYFEATASQTYDLDAVTFVPSTTKKTTYTEVIPFTCYGTTGKVLNGTMEIKVGESMNFTDVKATDYFYDAVVWAVGEGITSGTSSTTFSPNATCTRAQVVTFLYRAAGEPTVTGVLPFTDVKYTDYYYDAVLWAYKNNITTGLTATTFGPNATVTRGQVVTFLARALKGSTSSAYNPFTDVKATDYFYDAVLWAVKEGVTTGLSATSFGPNSGCTRGQIVTFLYRAYEG